MFIKNIYLSIHDKRFQMSNQILRTNYVSSCILLVSIDTTDRLTDIVIFGYLGVLNLKLPSLENSELNNVLSQVNALVDSSTTGIKTVL